MTYQQEVGRVRQVRHLDLSREMQVLFLIVSISVTVSIEQSLL